ncbi:hypothetical protein C0416_01975 [bacterium]|nr:hypothetical protein [bacterium]
MKDGVISITVESRERDSGASRTYEIPLKSGFSIPSGMIPQIHNYVARLLFDEYEILNSESAMEIRGVEVKAYSEEEIQTMIVGRVRDIAAKNRIAEISAESQ